MKIQPSYSNFYQNNSFKGAMLNINAFSDTHGELLCANNALEEMRSRKVDIFCKSDDKASANVIAVCGDWFMDGARKGYITNPGKEVARFQLDIFNEFIRQIKGIASNTMTLFTPGNHEFDGGVKLLDDVLANLDAEVLFSNLDISSSDGFQKSISGNKIINEKIVAVEDDKNPELKHKFLFLGISPVNMPAYQKKLDGVSLIDAIPKPQRYVTKEDYEKTLEYCKGRISEFKKQNPKGHVILMSHTGVKFADTLARESEVDLVFDGHEHKDPIRVVNGTPIVPLSQNFKKIVNAKMKVDDEGNLADIGLKSFSPLENKTKGPLLKLYRKLFAKDTKNKYSIRTDKENVQQLDIKDVRQGNSFLANFITDTILEELKKKDGSIDFFALNSSSIRHPLNVSMEPKNSFLDVMSVLSGIKEEEAKILTTELSGHDILYMILDNFLFNKDMPQQNPLIHYSGLIIDRTSMLEKYEQNTDINELAKYVIITQTGKPIDPEQHYKIANVEKYFNKSQNSRIKEFKDYSEYTGYTLQELFKKHFQESDGKLYAKCDVRIR